VLCDRGCDRFPLGVANGGEVRVGDFYEDVVFVRG
jgi:hypothetical protein